MLFLAFWFILAAACLLRCLRYELSLLCQYLMQIAGTIFPSTRPLLSWQNSHLAISLRTPCARDIARSCCHQHSEAMIVHTWTRVNMPWATQGVGLNIPWVPWS
jgi:hypothetical protein